MGVTIGELPAGGAHVGAAWLVDARLHAMLPEGEAPQRHLALDVRRPFHVFVYDFSGLAPVICVAVPCAGARMVVATPCEPASDSFQLLVGQLVALLLGESNQVFRRLAGEHLLLQLGERSSSLMMCLLHWWGQLLQPILHVCAGMCLEVHGAHVAAVNVSVELRG